MVSTKAIPHIRISPRVVLFDSDDLDTWIAERTVQPSGADVKAS
jgi:predicted DNA-binding transcriptional regulator AlpA